MMQRAGLIPVFIAAGVLGACQEPSGFGRSYSYPDAVEVTSSQFQVVMEGDQVPELPSVRSYRIRAGEGIEGQSVVFTLKGPDGSTSVVNVSTDVNGVARLPEWSIDKPGVYTATANLERSGPFVFRAVKPGELVAIYDLVSLDGRALPRGSTKDGHYALYEGGVYNERYNSPVLAFSGEVGVFGTYEWVDASRVFFIMEIPGAPLNRNFLAAPGLIEGRRMTIDRGSPFDYAVEVYERR